MRHRKKIYNYFTSIAQRYRGSASGPIVRTLTKRVYQDFSLFEADEHRQDSALLGRFKGVIDEEQLNEIGKRVGFGGGFHKLPRTGSFYLYRSEV